MLRLYCSLWGAPSAAELYEEEFQKFYSSISSRSYFPTVVRRLSKGVGGALSSLGTALTFLSSLRPQHDPWWLLMPHNPGPASLNLGPQMKFAILAAL